VYLIWRLRGRKLKDPNLPPRWGLLFFYAYLAGLSHILLDFTNSYGVRPFWPLSEKWYSWDIVFIYEPFLYVFLFGGLLLPVLFGLINEEIGARQKGPKGRMAAMLALLAMAALWGVRDYEHRRAVNALQARTYDEADPLRVAAYPYPSNPFRWYAVVETPSFFARMRVDSLVPDVDPDGSMRLTRKPEEMPVTLAAKESYLGRVYLDWAAYPVTETEPLDSGGYVVRFRDLRYAYPEFEGRNTLGAYAELDQNLRVVNEGFGPRKP
jgi:inner membrane protein